MKILLFNPPRFEGVSVIREERCEIIERYSVLEPYSLLQLGAILRNKKHSVSLIDANGFDIKYSDLKLSKCDVLIFRFTPTTFDHDMRICSLAKKINPKVLTIGICFTLGKIPLEVMKEAGELDIFVLSDYELVVLNILKNLNNLRKVDGIAYRKNRKIFINKPSNAQIDYDRLPLPAYDLLPSLKPYFINTPVGKPFTIMYTSKGCPYNCAYCTVAGTKLKVRSAKSVIREIRYLKENYKIRTISFFDETFTVSRHRVLEICNALGDMNITWYCNTRVNLVDYELLKIMRKSGCRGISYGIESGNQKILNNVSKGVTVEQQKNAIKWAKKTGMKVLASFIF